MFFSCLNHGPPGAVSCQRDVKNLQRLRNLPLLIGAQTSGSARLWIQVRAEPELRPPTVVANGAKFFCTFPLDKRKRIA
jgi:hypothetical protein